MQVRSRANWACKTCLGRCPAKSRWQIEGISLCMISQVKLSGSNASQEAIIQIGASQSQQSGSAFQGLETLAVRKLALKVRDLKRSLSKRAQFGWNSSDLNSDLNSDLKANGWQGTAHIESKTRYANRGVPKAEELCA